MGRRRDVVIVIHVVVQADLADTGAQRIIERGNDLRVNVVGIIRRAIGMNASEILDLRNIPHR